MIVFLLVLSHLTYIESGPLQAQATSKQQEYFEIEFNDIPPPLIADAPSGGEDVVDEEDPIIVRSRAIDVNFGLLGGTGNNADSGGRANTSESISLNLFDDVTLVAVQDRVEPLTSGGYVWFGKIEGQELSQAIFVVKDGTTTANIRVPAGVYQIRPADNGEHLVLQIDESGFPEDPNDGILPPKSENNFTREQGDSARSSDDARQVLVDDGSIIDVMVVYTADARQAADGTAAMESLIALGVAETNQSYTDSGINTQIRLVHQAEVVYTETGDSSIDLPRLRNTSDGFMDEVHTLRDLYAADIVSLWTATDGGCGLGYLMTTPTDASFDTSAFNVTRQDCATGNYTFGHEMGHNMGARHDWYVDNNITPYTHAHGFASPANSWRTVMAYNNHCVALGGSCTRLARWSNPDLTHNGVDTGVDEGTDSSCATGDTGDTHCDADNRETINKHRVTIANFRATKVIATITKSVSDAFITPGSPLTYTIVLSNSTNSTANNIVVTDTIPANTTLQAGSISDGGTSSGSSAGSIVTWNVGNLAAGQEVSRTFSVIPDSGLAKGAEITNSAYLSSTSITDTQASNVVISMLDGADCGFSDDFESGSFGEYWSTSTTISGTIFVANSSGNANSGSRSVWFHQGQGTVDNGSTAEMVLRGYLAGRSGVNLNFAWRSFFTSGSAHADDGVYISDDGGINWVKIYSFTVSGSSTSYSLENINLDAVTASNGLTLNDNFRVKFQVTDGPTSGYAVDDVSITCSSSDLQISKSVAPATAAPGDAITYTLSYANIGTGTASSVYITDTIPVTLTNVSFTSSGPTITATGSTPYTWQVTDLVSNTTGVITVTGVVSAGLSSSTSFTNTATITATNDLTPTNNSAAAELTVNVSGPSLALTKIVTPTVAAPGDTITYTILVHNSGAGNATGAGISDTLPSELTLSGAIALDPSDAGTVGSDAPGLANNLTITAGQSVTLTFAAVVSASASNGTQVNNTAAVTSAQNSTPVQGQVSFDVVMPPVDLAITKVVDPIGVSPGDTITYTIAFTNLGTGTATGVVITDIVPATITVSSVTSGGVAITDTGAAPAYTWDVADMVGGATGQITLIGVVSANLLSNISVINDVTITATNEMTASNNSGQASLMVHVPQPTLALTKTVTPTIAAPGDTITYTILVHNSGTGNATGAGVSDTLPSELTLSGAIILEPSSAGTVGSDAPGLASNLTITAGQSVTLTFTAIVSDSVSNGTQVNNTAAVTSAQDSTPIQGQVSFNVVVPPVDLTIDKAVTPATAAPGDTITYTIAFTNLGTGTATGVVITDIVPATITVSSVISNGVAITDTGTTPAYTWNVADMDGGASGQIMLVGVVSASLVNNTNVINQATITATNETATNNNSSQASLTVNVPQPTLALTKNVTPETVISGSTVTYTIQVHNSGTGNATGATISDTLPSGLFLSSDITLEPSGAGTVGNGTPELVSNLTITAGQSVTVTFAAIVYDILNDGNGNLVPSAATARASDSDAEQINNTASVTSAQNSTPVQGSVQITVVSPALSISKSSADPNGAPLFPNDLLSYTITVNNTGSANATNITISDTVPSDATYIANSITGGDSNDDSSAPSLGWVINTLAPNASVVLNYAASVNTGVATGTQIINTAAVTSTEIFVPATASVTNTVVVTAYGLQIIPNNATNAIQGQIVAYNHTLTNLGNVTDIFSLTIASSQGYPVTINGSSAVTVTLAGSASTVVAVSVSIPATAALGTVDLTTVTVSSSYSATMTGTATNTTTVYDPAGPTPTSTATATPTPTPTPTATPNVGTLSGTVTDPTAAGLANIRLYLYRSDGFSWRYTGTAITGSGGTYSFTGLTADSYRLCAYDYRSNRIYSPKCYDNAAHLYTGTDIVVTGGLLSNINIAFDAVSQIEGNVSSTAGAGLQGIYVYAYTLKSYSSGSYWSFGGSARTDTSGNYTMSPLASGTYRVGFFDWQNRRYTTQYYNGASDRDSATDVVVGSGATVSNINAVLSQGGSITGTVTSVSGSPLANTYISVYRQDGSRWRWTGNARTNSAGQYQVNGLTTDTYRVRFYNWRSGFAPQYYQGISELESATNVAVTDGVTTPNIDATMTPYGEINGTVTQFDGTPAADIYIHLYKLVGSQWRPVTSWNQTNSAGQYSIGRLSNGTYRIGFFNSRFTDASAYEFFDDVTDLNSATNIVVTNGNTATANAQLPQPAEPIFVPPTGTGRSSVTDPQTGQVTIRQVNRHRANLTITKAVSCPDGSTPTNVTLQMVRSSGTRSYPMTESPTGSGTYVATIPRADQQRGSADIKVSKSCNGSNSEETIGKIVLYDPSGFITDAVTGAPIVGATVTLYKVPGWGPKQSPEDTSEFTCQSNLSKDEDHVWDDPVTQAMLDVAIIADPDSGEIDPEQNPQLTDDTGYYAWDVAEGCWYIVVQADGYDTKTSPVVGVPPEVTDLHQQLQPFPTAVPTSTPIPFVPQPVDSTPFPTHTPVPTSTPTMTPTPTPTSTPHKGTIIIQVQAAASNDNPTFEFEASAPLLGIFWLFRDGNQSFGEVEPGLYTIRQLGAEGWSLSSLNCSDPDNGTVVNGNTVTIDLDDRETITCVFENRPIISATDQLPPTQTPSPTDEVQPEVTPEEKPTETPTIAPIETSDVVPTDVVPTETAGATPTVAPIGTSDVVPTDVVPTETAEATPDATPIASSTPPMAFTISTSEGVPGQGERILIFLLSYQNTGTETMTNIQLNATIPGLTTFSIERSDPRWNARVLNREALGTCPDGHPAGNVCILELGDIAPNQEETDVRFSVKLDRETIAGASISFTATISGDELGSTQPEIEEEIVIEVEPLLSKQLFLPLIQH